VTYAQAEAALLALPRFALQGADALKPGLERIRALLAALGDPHERFAAVQVGGTNGKGSTASLLAAVLTAGGARVGLHTSPHLHHLGERMRVDGAPAPAGWLAGAVERLEAPLAAVRPSFFEATLALSLLYFAERDVDVAVVEVGLGGRLDATTVLSPRLAIVTHIARDHAEILGDTLEAIAREKAGIAKHGVPLLTAVAAGPPLAALRREAASRGAPVENVRETCTVEVTAADAAGLTINLATPLARHEGLRVGLAGRHQAWNAALAVRAAEHLGAPAGPALREGLRGVARLAGLAFRCEVIQTAPVVMVDVSHNADGLTAALAALAEVASGEVHVVMGLMRDKELPEVAAVLAARADSVTTVDLEGERAWPAASLAEALRQRGVNAAAGSGVPAAIDHFRRSAGPDDGLLVTGSHQTAAQARPSSG
jgi:dihydrofolate synthase / folylpolyglutamate synthase